MPSESFIKDLGKFALWSGRSLLIIVAVGVVVLLTIGDSDATFSLLFWLLVSGLFCTFLSTTIYIFVTDNKKSVGNKSDDEQ